MQLCVFFFFYSRAAVSVVFPPCCPVQVLSCSLFASCIFIWTNKDDDDDCVYGDRPSQWEMANFDPSQNRNPWADCNKIQHIWLRARGDTLNRIWYKSIHWGLLGIWVKYNVFVPFIFIYLFIPFFWDSRTGQTGWWLFMRDSSLDAKSRKDVLFRGYKT